MAKEMLSKHFSLEELSCRCGCGQLPEQETIVGLENLRELCGFPIPISSGARCRKHNKSVGGKMFSYHLRGLAADIPIKDSQKRFEIIRNSPAAGFNCILLYPDNLHIDRRKSPPLCNIADKVLKQLKKAR